MNGHKCLPRLKKEFEFLTTESNSQLFKIIHLDSEFNTSNRTASTPNWQITFIPIEQSIQDDQEIGNNTPPSNESSFSVDFTFPEKYPFVPPIVKMITHIPQHPNIDSQGNICMDILKLPPNGTWKPIFNIVTILTCLCMLLAEPNYQDPLNSLPTELPNQPDTSFLQHSYNLTKEPPSKRKCFNLKMKSLQSKDMNVP